MSETKPAAPTTHRSRWSTWLLLVVLVVAFLWLFSRSANRELTPGQKLTALDLVSLTGGGPVTLDDLRGKVVLLNFWATWCGPCQVELPELAALAGHFAGNPDFRFLPVACDDDDLDTLRTKVAATLRRLDVNLPTYADPSYVTRNAFNQVSELQGFPTTLLLDRDGVVRAVWVGYSPSAIDEMETKAQHLLDESGKRGE